MNARPDDFGAGYTLATGRLFCSMETFLIWMADLIGRPVYSHELAIPEIWTVARRKFEERMKPDVE